MADLKDAGSRNPSDIASHCDTKCPCDSNQASNLKTPSRFEASDHASNHDVSSNQSDTERIEMQTIHRASSGERAPTAVELSEEPALTLTEAVNNQPSYTSSATAWRLYLSHLLSTWNSRSFEFGSVLFLAHIYPNTLLYFSIYGMCRSSAGIVLSTTIGKAIDRKPRLQVVRSSIGRLIRPVPYAVVYT